MQTVLARVAWRIAAQPSRLRLLSTASAHLQAVQTENPVLLGNFKEFRWNPDSQKPYLQSRKIETGPMILDASIKIENDTLTLRRTPSSACAASIATSTTTPKSTRFPTSGRGKTFGRLQLKTWETRSRGLHSSAVTRHGHVDRPEPGTGIKVHFKDSKGNLIKTVEANEGDDLLSIAHEYDIDLEGACEGSVACSTCHVILTPDYYDRLPEPDDEENDMLDMAFGLTDTSRLGCQVILKRELDGMSATLPSATRNMFVDGKKPSH
ncbi:hypothetical protein E4T56_gene7957 [Termitomyces sp. T112]|nr:hypothetical protein E4T56_gene7957 [Termitomyces sp. T112]